MSDRLTFKKPTAKQFEAIEELEERSNRSRYLVTKAFGRMISVRIMGRLSDDDAIEAVAAALTQERGSQTPKASGASAAPAEPPRGVSGEK